MEKEKILERLEIIIAIFLGIVAVMTAWASWQESLYGGNQATSYTKSNSVISEANSLYNEASQYIAQDMNIWNQISNLRIELAFAEEYGDKVEAKKVQWKLDQIMADNVSKDLQGAIEWADAQETYASPFDMEGFIDGYYVDAQEKYAEGEKLLEEGQKANSLGDELGMVTVIYAMVLFILGIAVSFNKVGTRLALISVSTVGFIFAMVIMIRVPILSL